MTVLLDDMGSSDPGLRQAAAEALANWPGDRAQAIDALGSIIRGPRPESATSAIEAFVRSGTASLAQPHLLWALHEGTPELRARAIEALSRFEDPRTILTQMIDALDDTSLDVRLVCVNMTCIHADSLADLRRAIVPKLLRLLGTDWYCGLQAAQTLHRCYPEADDSLEVRLEAWMHNEPNEWRQGRLDEVLADIRYRRSHRGD